MKKLSFQVLSSFTNVDFDQMFIAACSRATNSRVWQRRVNGRFISMTSAGITKKQASKMVAWR